VRQTHSSKDIVGCICFCSSPWLWFLPSPTFKSHPSML
jgi:hypothetical protein